MEMRSEDPFEQEESSMRFLHRLELERALKSKVMVLCIWCCHVLFHKVQTTPLKGIFPKTAKKAFMVLLSIPIAPWIWFSFPTLPSGCINPQNSGKWSTFSLILTWIATTPNNLLFGYRETKQWFFFFFTNDVKTLKPDQKVDQIKSIDQNFPQCEIQSPAWNQPRN